MKKNKAHNVEVDGIDPSDAPKFCDAYVSYAEHENGTPFTADELDSLNENSDFVHEQVIAELH
jgi:hypothetical protein